MSIDSNDNWSDEEILENELHYLSKALHVLSLSPEQQCEAMGNINVAWELHSDVARGLSFINDRSKRFSPEQRAVALQLVDLLARIPKSVLAQASSYELNVQAMRHPSWNGPRKHAILVIRAFGFCSESTLDDDTDASSEVT